MFHVLHGTPAIKTKSAEIKTFDMIVCGEVVSFSSVAESSGHSPGHQNLITLLTWHHLFVDLFKSPVLFYEPLWIL